MPACPAGSSSKKTILAHRINTVCTKQVTPKTAEHMKVHPGECGSYGSTILILKIKVKFKKKRIYKYDKRENALVFKNGGYKCAAEGWLQMCSRKFATSVE